MTWLETKQEIERGLKSLGYNPFKGRQVSFEKGSGVPDSADKVFVIRGEGIDSKSITGNGTIGTHKVVIEIIYKGVTQDQYNANYNLFTDLTTKLFDRSKFPSFFNLNGDSQFNDINNKQLGIIKLFYGLRG